MTSPKYSGATGFKERTMGPFKGFTLYAMINQKQP
jgi:hypothetical protein